MTNSTIELAIRGIAMASALGLALSGPVLADEGEVSSEDRSDRPAIPEATATPRTPPKLMPSGGLADNPPEEVLTISGRPVFVPPNRGTPVARVGGATRSAQPLPGIEALVPLESGLTLEPDPVLYWYVSQDTELPINFTLLDIHEDTPLLDVTIEGPFERGVQRVKLGEYGARLEEGHLYQWFVALVPDPEDRSSDRLAGGGIERVAMKAWLAKRMREAAPEQQPLILAGAGVWYDALDLLSERIDAAPGNPAPREQRDALFEQVGLGSVVRPD